MWKDPTVEETRKLREQYAKEFNHDLEAIYTEILNRQKEKKHKLDKLGGNPSTKLIYKNYCRNFSCFYEPFVGKLAFQKC